MGGGGGGCAARLFLCFTKYYFFPVQPSGNGHRVSSFFGLATNEKQMRSDFSLNKIKKITVGFEVFTTSKCSSLKSEHI